MHKIERISPIAQVIPILEAIMSFQDGRQFSFLAICEVWHMFYTIFFFLPNVSLKSVMDTFAIALLESKYSKRQSEYIWYAIFFSIFSQSEKNLIGCLLSECS